MLADYAFSALFPSSSSSHKAKGFPSSPLRILSEAVWINLEYLKRNIFPLVVHQRVEGILYNFKIG